MGRGRVYMRQLALIGAIVVAGSAAEAAPAQLNDDELRAAVTGKTVKIDTPLGLPITVVYAANGLMSGTAGLALGAYLGSTRDRGRWHVRNGKLCTKWFKWLGSDASCMTLRQEGLKIYWHSDEGKSGTAMIEPGPPVLAGATASALGVPITPAPTEVREAKPSVPAEAAPPEQQEEAAPAAAAETAVVRPSVDEGKPRLDSLASAWRPVVSHDRAPASAPPPRVVLASMTPQRAMHAAPVSVAPTPSGLGDPFARSALPMRTAADFAAIGAMEHRWCLANALGHGPSIAHGGIPVPARVAAPSLLAVTHEQNYDGELPLYDPSCLTEDPAIAIVGRFASVVTPR